MRRVLRGPILGVRTDIRFICVGASHTRKAATATPVPIASAEAILEVEVVDESRKYEGKN